MQLGYDSGRGECKQACQGRVGLVRAWNQGMNLDKYVKHLTI